MRYTLLIALLTFSAVADVDAQETLCPANAQAPDSSRSPDFVIRASASAESIRFETQPQVEIRLNGCAVLDTVRVLERRNLPDPVQPGVTYRNVYIATEVLGYLNVDCLLEGLAGDVDIQPSVPGAQPAEGGAAGDGARGGVTAQVPGCGTAAGGAEPAVPSATPLRTPAAAPSPAQPLAPGAPQGQAVPTGSGATGRPQGLAPHMFIVRPHLAFSGREHTSGRPREIGRLRA